MGEEGDLEKPEPLCVKANRERDDGSTRFSLTSRNEEAAALLARAEARLGLGE